MMCYRDMTFCRGDGCAKFATCPRALTPEIEAAAKARSLEIAQFEYPKKLGCYEPKTTPPKEVQA